MRRVLYAVVVGIAALALAPAAGAQSLGEVAAKEKEKRKAKTGKVYSDGDLRKGGSSGEATPDAATGAAGSAPTRPAGEAGVASSETATTEGTSDEQLKADKARADSEKAWRDRWTKASDENDRAQGELNRMLEAYNKMPETMRDQALLDASRKKAEAAAQALAALDDERRKNGFAR